MADFDIKITDNSGDVMRAFKNQLQIALEAVGTQAESHAKQVISDSLVYGHTDLRKYGEKDNSRVDTGRLRNSVAHTVVKHDAYIGSNLPYSAYHELGTGIYASQAGGRQTPWVYYDRKEKAHRTKGLYPIHFLKKAASEHTEEYKKIIEMIMTGR
jgi:phage gpG-like protein